MKRTIVVVNLVAIREDNQTGRDHIIADIKFEQACILYNIGALHSNLGAIDTRQNAEAQAQECILEKSMIDSRKNTITAKVSAQVVEFYRQSVKNLDQCNNEQLINSRSYKDWKKRIDLKIAFYQCITHYYMGRQVEDQQKWGERLAYFQAAQDKLNEAVKLSKNEVPEMQEALRFAQDVVGAPLVKGIPFDPTDPEISGPDIFQKLVPMEAHEASSVYSQFMASLQIDRSIFDQLPERLPQELLEKCAAMSVRTNAIKELVDSMSGLATEAEMNIKEIQEMIAEDGRKTEEFEQMFGKKMVSTVLPNMLKDCEGHMEKHTQGSQLNATLHQAMNAHITNLRLLVLPPDQLQAQLPPARPPRSPEDEAVLDELRRLLSKVDEMKSQRATLEQQFREQIQKDDITSVLVAQESSKESIYEAQLKKHDNVIGLIRQNVAAQSNILRALTDTNAKFAALRQTILQQFSKRETMVKDLINSFEKYEELLAKSNKGQDYYRKLNEAVMKTLERCRSECKVRQEERDMISAKYAPKGVGGHYRGMPDLPPDITAAAYSAANTSRCHNSNNNSNSINNPSTSNSIPSSSSSPNTNNSNRDSQDRVSSQVSSTCRRPASTGKWLDPQHPKSQANQLHNPSPPFPASPEGSKHTAIPAPIITPKVLTDQEKQQQKEEAVKKGAIVEKVKDPYENSSVLNKFVSDVEAFGKFVDDLSISILGVSRLDTVWKSLIDSQDHDVKKQSIAIARCYPMKNRDPDIMPYDETRVVLSTTKDDYVNASWINDLAPSCPKFVATQAPLSVTMTDFWAMVYELGSEVIVQITSEYETGKKFPVYFPTEKGQQMEQGPIILNLQSVKYRQLWTERNVYLKHSQTKQGRTVIHLQFKTWPVSGFPDDVQHVLRFISEVHSFYQQQRSLLKPVIVHCGNGIGRTGAFLMIYTGIQEMLHGNGLIDVPALAKRMLQKRKNIIHKKEQLKFCYDALLCFAEDFLKKHDIVLGSVNLRTLQQTVGRLHVHAEGDKPATGVVDESGQTFLTHGGGIGTGHSRKDSDPVSALPDLIQQPSRSDSGLGQIGSIGSGTSLGSGQSAAGATFINNGGVGMDGGRPGIGSPMARSRSGSNTSQRSMSSMAESGSSRASPQHGPSSAASSTAAGGVSQALADLQDPSKFTLGKGEQKKRITKETFERKGSGAGLDTSQDPADPLSSLDPMWTIHKPKGSEKK
nr:hypothetical protein BaRGS_001083 [Batillaria attramentaria]